jgi:hypothetical protein
MTVAGGKGGGKQSAARGFVGKIAAATAILIALSALVDATNSLFNKTEPIVCKLGFSWGLALPGCGPKKKLFTSAGAAKATSAGQDGTRFSQICEGPPDEWHFVPNSGTGVPRAGSSISGAGGFGHRKDVPYKGDITPEQACFTVWAYTGDERVSRTFEAGFTALIERDTWWPHW